MYCFKAECLKEAINEIESSNDFMEILISVERGMIRLSTSGIAGDAHVKIKFIIAVHFSKTSIAVSVLRYISLHFILLRLIYPKAQSLSKFLTVKKLVTTGTKLILSSTH